MQTLSIRVDRDLLARIAKIVKRLAPAPIPLQRAAVIRAAIDLGLRELEK